MNANHERWKAKVAPQVAATDERPYIDPDTHMIHPYWAKIEIHDLADAYERGRMRKLRVVSEEK